MSEEKAGVLERMTTALVGGSADIEVMRALGSAQGRYGKLPADEERELTAILGKEAGRLHMVVALGRCLTALQTAQAQLAQARVIGITAIDTIVERLSAAKRWALGAKNIRRVADGALLMHTQPACPHCSGRRYELIPGTDTVGTRICRPCGGTGQRPYPKRFKAEIAATLSLVAMVQGLAERAVAKELR